MNKINGALESGARPGKRRKAKLVEEPIRRASARSAAVRTLTEVLVQSLQQCRIAQVLIEQLLKHNSRLEQELLQVTRREEQARRLAYHDALTGLPNRVLLRDRFSQAMSQAKRHRKLVAMLLIDLDGFKSVNDQLGHGAGDKLLCAAAARMVEGIRGEDTVCRYGGDEFVIMLPEVGDAAMAAAAAEKIYAHLAEPHVVDGYEIRVTASIGIALYPADGKSYEQLMNNVDEAMYRAKAGSRRASITALPDGNPAESTSAISDGGKVRGIGNAR